MFAWMWEDGHSGTTAAQLCSWKLEVPVCYSLLLLSIFSFWKLFHWTWSSLIGEGGWPALKLQMSAATVSLHVGAVTPNSSLMLANLLTGASFQPLSLRLSDSSMLLHRRMICWFSPVCSSFLTWNYIYSLSDVHWGAANCIRCLHRLTSAQKFLQVSSASLGHIKLIKNDWPHLSSHQQWVRAHTFKLLLLLACFFRLWGCQYGSHRHI